MQQGYSCPNCRRPLRYIQHYQNWYCDSCRMYPFQQQMAMPYYPPPQKDDSKVILWIIAILVIIFVVLPVILVGIMILTMGDMIEPGGTTPTGAMHFEESSSQPGQYTGSVISLSQVLDIEDVQLTITDASTGASDTMSPLVSGGSVTAGTGMSCTFTDTNSNGRLDAADTFVVRSGGTSDRLRLSFRPTGGVISTYTLG